MRNIGIRRQRSVRGETFAHRRLRNREQAMSQFVTNFYFACRSSGTYESPASGHSLG
jgi:hypothetical protein